MTRAARRVHADRAPTAEFRQHHDVHAPRVDRHAFRQGWRVHTRLDSLLAAGRITPGEWQAASEYRDTWGRVMAAMGATDVARLVLVAGASDAHERLGRVVGAVTRLRRVEALTGSFAAALCFACVVQDRPWADTARILCRDPHTARAWTTEAIRVLAAAWTGARRHERAFPLSGSGQDREAVYGLSRPFNGHVTLAA